MDVATRKNRSFCGMGGVIWPLFWHIFESRSFCGTEAQNRRFWRNLLLSAERDELRRSPDGARTFGGRPFENVSKMTPRVPDRPFCGEKRFMSCEGAQTFAWLRGSPPSRHPVLGFPRSSCPGLPRSSCFASFCGRKRFAKNCGAPSQLKI